MNKMSSVQDEPFGYYWTGSQPPLSKSLNKFEDWCEDEDISLRLSYDDQFNRDFDQEVAESFISKMNLFLQQHYTSLGINLTLFGQKPIKYQNCKFALWIYKNFSHKFMALESDVFFCESYGYQNYTQIGLCPKLPLSNHVLYALVRYTKVLRSKECTIATLQRNSPETAKLLGKINSVSISLTAPKAVWEGNTEQKSCWDECVLF